MNLPLRVIWLDTSSRRKNLIEAWGESGDWFASDVTDISDVDAVFVHATDAQIICEDEDIEGALFADQSLGTEKLVERLRQFRTAVRNIATKPAPLIVLYTGEDDGGGKIREKFRELISDYSSDLLRCTESVGREVSVETLKSILVNHIKSATQDAADQAVKEAQEDIQVGIDVSSAVMLAAEVIMWLRETSKQEQNPSREMVAITDRLRKVFGDDGETLKNDLIKAVSTRYPEKSGIALIALEEKIACEIDNVARIGAWTNAGMLTS